MGHEFDIYIYMFYGAASAAGLFLLTRAVMSLVKSIKARRASLWERRLRKVTIAEHKKFISDQRHGIKNNPRS